MPKRRNTKKTKKIKYVRLDESHLNDSLKRTNIQVLYSKIKNNSGEINFMISSSEKNVSVQVQKESEKLKKFEVIASGNSSKQHSKDKKEKKDNKLNLLSSTKKKSYRRNFIESNEKKKKLSHNVLEEINEDLFNLPEYFPLAHCIDEDLKMEEGIAVKFKRIFGGVGKLLDQKLTVGDVGIVNRHNRNVFYLIINKDGSGKTKIKSLKKALISLLNKMKELNLTKLGIPLICCGLRDLNWSNVSLLINHIFSGSNIHITACKYSKIECTMSWPLKAYLTSKNLWEIGTETALIIFINVRNVHTDICANNVLNEVNNIYSFKENLLRDIKNKNLYPGDIMEYCVKDKVIFCVFTDRNEYFGSIEEGFSKINKLKKRKCLAIHIGGSIDSNRVFKNLRRILLVYRSVLIQSELWLCGQADKGEKLSYDLYCNYIRQYYPNSRKITTKLENIEYSDEPNKYLSQRCLRNKRRLLKESMLETDISHKK